MDIDRLNGWLALIANVGVLVGIIFLAVELDQSNRIGAYSAENARRNQWISINQNGIENAEFLAKLETTQELSPSEEVQALMHARQLINSWEDAEAAYNYGLLSDRSFEVTLVDIQVVVNEIPGIRPYFEYLVSNYELESGASRVWETMAEAVKVH